MPTAEYYREQAVLEEARARLEADQQRRSSVMLVAHDRHADANFAEMIEIGTRWTPVGTQPVIRA